MKKALLPIQLLSAIFLCTSAYSFKYDDSSHIDYTFHITNNSTRYNITTTFHNLRNASTPPDNPPGENDSQLIQPGASKVVFAGNEHQVLLFHYCIQSGNTDIMSFDLPNLFGSSVGISGDTAVIGAPGEENSSGAVYIYSHDENGWIMKKRLTCPDAPAMCNFGSSACISGSNVIIRASGVNAVYTVVPSGWALTEAVDTRGYKRSDTGTRSIGAYDYYATKE